MNSLEILRQWLRARHARPTSDNATILQLWCVESVDKVFMVPRRRCPLSLQSCLQVVDSETQLCGEDLEFELVNRLMSEEVNRSEFDRPALRHVDHRTFQAVCGGSLKHPQPYQRKSTISLMHSRNNSWYLLKGVEAMNIKTNYWLDHRCCMNYCVESGSLRNQGS